MIEAPPLASIDLWERHEARCLTLLRQSLALLAPGPPDERENAINRRLYRAISDAQVEAARRGEEPVAPVVPEGMNPPDVSDEQRAAREDKRPDFYWGVIDHLAEPGTARQYVLECKRLTRKSRKWSYTHQYSNSGILRFLSEDHGYGKGASGGAMVGYLQQIDTDLALAEVNKTAAAAGIPHLMPSPNWEAGTLELAHVLDRPFPDSPYLLSHLWTRTAPAMDDPPTE
jgi:hypothetical protein